MFGALKNSHNASKFGVKLGLAYNWMDDAKVPIWVGEAYANIPVSISQDEAWLFASRAVFHSPLFRRRRLTTRGTTRRDTATATSRSVSNITRNMNVNSRLNVRPR